MPTASKKTEAVEKKETVIPAAEAPAVEAPKAAETPVAEKPAAEKKEGAKKPGRKPGRKPGPKPGAKKAASKASEKETAPKAAEKKPAARRTRAAKAVAANVVLEYQGRQLFQSDLVERAKRVWADAGRTVAIESMDLYVKPEDGAVYCVINGEPCGKFYF